MDLEIPALVLAESMGFLGWRAAELSTSIVVAGREVEDLRFLAIADGEREFKAGLVCR